MGNSFPPEPKVPRLFLDSSVIIAGLASRTGASHAPFWPRPSLDSSDWLDVLTFPAFVSMFGNS